jgi:hypothetical protein
MLSMLRVLSVENVVRFLCNINSPNLAQNRMIVLDLRIVVHRLGYTSEALLRMHTLSVRTDRDEVITARMCKPSSGRKAEQLKAGMAVPLVHRFLGSLVPFGV